MLSQCWVIRDNTALAAVSHQPVASKYEMGAVLISGFSQPMCDAYFFMARLARRLASEGIYVLQVDPRGHGDSPGCLEDVTLDTLREDIQTAANYAREQSGAKIICIGRGLTATLMAELDICFPVYGIAGINPYCLEPATVKDLFKKIDSGIVDTADILTGSDYRYFSDFDRDLMAFFDALGSGLPYNLLGQNIAMEFIRELMAYDPHPAISACPEAKFWLIANKSAAEGMCRWMPDEGAGLLYRSLREYRKNPFPTNPLWYHNAIERICDWIVAKRGEGDANTGSNRR